MSAANVVNDVMVDQPQTAPHSRAFLPVLVLLFIGSGCAALIYEIVWFQMLGLVIGSSAISLGVLLGTFMGGMFLGSLLAPRFIPRTYHPLRVYAAMELGIGIIGLLIGGRQPRRKRNSICSAAIYGQHASHVEALCSSSVHRGGLGRWSHQFRHRLRNGSFLSVTVNKVAVIADTALGEPARYGLRKLEAALRAKAIEVSEGEDQVSGSDLVLLVGLGDRSRCCGQPLWQR